MALIKCKECGKEISNTVKQCIHCGYIIKEKKLSQKKDFKDLTKDDKQKIFRIMKKQTETNEIGITILSILCVADVMLILITNNIWLLLLMFGFIIGLFVEINKANKKLKDFYDNNDIDL